MCIFTSDWYPVWNDTSYWTMEDMYGDHFKIYFGFTILYSPKRRRYKLKTYGKDPKDSPLYSKAIVKLNVLIKGQEQGPEHFDFKSDPTA